MKDEIRIIGIIHERDVDNKIFLKELKKIIFECLQLGPMYKPLIDILEKNN